MQNTPTLRTNNTFIYAERDGSQCLIPAADFNAQTRPGTINYLIEYDVHKKEKYTPCLANQAQSDCILHVIRCPDMGVTASSTPPPQTQKLTSLNR